MTISLLTNGWICYRRLRIIRRYVLPLDLQVKSVQDICLYIKNRLALNINTLDILDKNINLKLTSKNINIKRDRPNINIDK